ncbi:hypothetical protein ACIL2U_004738 [Vibrio alginolyticus]
MTNTDLLAPCALQSRYGKTVSIRINNPELLQKIAGLPRGELTRICRTALIQYFEATEGAGHDYI